jgi:CubicO group peptidase (beta-lactamase class C family)
MLKPRLRFLAGAVLPLLLCLREARAAGSPPTSTVEEQPIIAFIEKAITEHHVPGMAVSLVRDGDVVWAKGFGLADIRANRPVNPDTLFVMASVSKTLIAAALMHAVQNHRLTLDADIDSWLPFPVRNPNFPDTKITLRQLATHSSGIIDNYTIYGGPDNYHDGGDNPTSLGAFLAAYLVPGGAYFSTQNFAARRPGSQWQYSNVGAALAGFVIESATGMPFDVYCHKFIFEPLGMVNTGWHQREVEMERHAIPYRSVDGQFVPHAHYGLATWPDGGLRTTVLDLSRFAAMILQGGALNEVTLMKPATVEAMLASQGVAMEHPGIPKGTREEAIFWQRSTQPDGSVRLQHGGSDPGAATMVVLDPKKHVGALVFVNTDPTDVVADDMSKIVDMLFQASGR